MSPAHLAVRELEAAKDHLIFTLRQIPCTVLRWTAHSSSPTPLRRIHEAANLLSDWAATIRGEEGTSREPRSSGSSARPNHQPDQEEPTRDEVCAALESACSAYTSAVAALEARDLSRVVTLSSGMEPLRLGEFIQLGSAHLKHETSALHRLATEYFEGRSEPVPDFGLGILGTRGTEPHSQST